jgi:PAS domain S-box-containing protein
MDGIAIVRADGRISYASPSFTRLVGFDPRELLGKLAFDYLHPDDLTRTQAAFSNALVADTTEIREEFRFRHKDGSWRVFESVVTNLVHEPTVAGLVINSRDITKRRAAEEALALKTAVLATQQESSLDAILVVDEHGKMISFNQRFVDLWNIPAEIAASGSDERALRWVADRLVDPEGFAARVTYLYEHREEMSREEVALKDGRTLDRYSAPMFGADGKYYGRVWYFRDITALKRVQMDQERALGQAEQASRTKSGFLANMSHELRTPLNSIIGFATLLAQNSGGNLTAQDLDFLGRIENNGKHLLEIINSILDLSKIEAGKVALEIADVSLGPLIRETLSLTGCVRRGGGLFVGEVEVRAEVPPGLRPIRADPGKLKQVLINLVGNALKFTERGSVTVRVVVDAATGEAERIDVADTGIGIPQQRQAAVFEAFEQADATTARRYRGSGLGLTISRTLLQQMGYLVSVTSEVGTGSTFTVHLRGAGTRYGASEPAPPGVAGPAPEPVSVTKAAATPPPADSPDKTEFHGYTILVIDDDADARLLLSHMISGHGATVLTASSGGEALELARSSRPHLVTVDVMMPQMSGWDLIHALRADPALRTIPALIVSVIADSSPSTLVGAEDRLNKPVNPEALLAALRRHLPRGGKAV